MRIKFKALLEYIVAICIILDCETIWKWMNHNGVIKLGIFAFLTASLMILIYIDKEKLKRKELPLVGLLFSYFGIFIIRNFSLNLASAIKFAISTFLMFSYFRREGKIKIILEKIYKIVVGLAIVSLFFFLFGNLLNILSPNGTLTIYVNNLPKICNSYFFFHYEVQLDDTFGFNFYRNTGIFYESPKYALLLSLVLMYDLFVVAEKNLKKDIILSITILTTISLTGIFALAIIWVAYLLFQHPIRTKKGLFTKFAFLILFLLVGYKIYSTFTEIIAIKGATASYSTRMDNYIAGYKAWKEYPIFGAGYLNMQPIIENYSSFRMNDIGYSNSLFRVLAQGGIYLFIMYLFPVIINFVRSVKSKNIFMIFFNMMFIYLFVTTSFPYNYIGIVILCLLLYYKNDIKQPN